MPEREVVKLARKDIKRPDQFLEWLAKGMNFSVTNFKYLLTVAGVLVLVIVSYGVLKTYLKRIEEKASSSLADITQKYEEAVKGYQDLEFSKQPDGRVTATLNPAAKDKLSKVREETDALVKTYKGTSAGQYGLLLSARVRMTLQDYAGAKEAYEGFLKADVARESQLRAAGLYGLSWSYEYLGDRKKAIQTLDELLGIKENSFEALALLALGRNHAALKENDEAIKAYERFIADSQDPLFTKFARAQVQMLKLKKEKL